ncbi:GFA family protein [Roseovarius rhodophyticola]|uniref:GFA family protein n=1 Tax=Roseovarius rhodophyticola TaxID=3080827 RepID=A0ABZ2TN64_9RHOB|nr:GFA family protein [Roseovarius sp. W115]MDV2929559.1 GFA family protein [Roseovarius sp. W115]
MTQRGSCLCGAVSFELSGKLRSVTACHCGQCRKQSGHYWAATSVADIGLCLTKDEGLTWFDASPTARRGFCKLCGSTLFWKPAGEDRTVISAGSLGPGSGLEITKHVHVADKGDYYDLSDGLPQFEALSGEESV